MVQRHEPTPGRIHQCRGLGFRGEGGEGGFWRRNGVRAGAVGGGGRGTVTVSGSWGSVLQLRLGFMGFLAIDHRWGCEGATKGPSVGGAAVGVPPRPQALGRRGSEGVVCQWRRMRGGGGQRKIKGGWKAEVGRRHEGGGEPEDEDEEGVAWSIDHVIGCAIGCPIKL
jgi:hypothetical protein